MSTTVNRSSPCLVCGSNSTCGRAAVNQCPELLKTTTAMWFSPLSWGMANDASFNTCFCNLHWCLCNWKCLQCYGECKPDTWMICCPHPVQVKQLHFWSVAVSHNNQIVDTSLRLATKATRPWQYHQTTPRILKTYAFLLPLQISWELGSLELHWSLVLFTNWRIINEMTKVAQFNVKSVRLPQHNVHSTLFWSEGLSLLPRLCLSLWKHVSIYSL